MNFLFIFVLLLSTQLQLTLSKTRHGVCENSPLFGSDDDSIINYLGNFNCSVQDTFCAVWYFTESDTIEHDTLEFLPLVCSKGRPMTQNIFVGLNENDGVYDSRFEPMLEVYHNCSVNGTVLKMNFPLEDVGVRSGYWKRSYKFDLTNKGTLDFEKQEALRFEKIRNLHETEQWLDGETVGPPIRLHTTNRWEKIKNERHSSKTLLPRLHKLMSNAKNGTGICDNSLAFPSEEDTMVRYDGVIKCSGQKNFCAMWYIRESDIIRDDELEFIPLVCAQNTIIRYDVFVGFNGNDGFMDYTFEPEMELYHNCTTTGTVKKADYFLNSVGVNTGYWKNSRDYEITDQGEEGFSIGQAMRFKENTVFENYTDTENWLNGVKETGPSIEVFTAARKQMVKNVPSNRRALEHRLLKLKKIK